MNNLQKKEIQLSIENIVAEFVKIQQIINIDTKEEIVQDILKSLKLAIN